MPVVRVTRATPVFPPGVTDDTPDLDREQVQLDIPSELFGNSASTTLRISEVIGQLVQVGSLFSSFVILVFCLKTFSRVHLTDVEISF